MLEKNLKKIPTAILQNIENKKTTLSQSNPEKIILEKNKEVIEIF